MAETVKCPDCKLRWIYAGYPAFIGCPRCGKTKSNYVKRQTDVCDCCDGTGKVKTSTVRDERFDECRTDSDAKRISSEVTEGGTKNAW